MYLFAATLLIFKLLEIFYEGFLFCRYVASLSGRTLLYHIIAALSNIQCCSNWVTTQNTACTLLTTVTLLCLGID